MAKKIVLVTGGSGLVGSAIREVIESEQPADEEWIFASSKVRAREHTRVRVIRKNSSERRWSADVSERALERARIETNEPRAFHLMI